MPANDRPTTSTRSYEVVGLKGAAIAHSTIGRAAALVGRLARFDGGEAGFGAERDWVTPNDVPAFGGMTGCTLATFTPRFVGTLRRHAYIFTGYHLDNIVAAQKVPSWTDQIGAHFPGGGWPDWSIPAFAQYRAEVPDELLCRPPLIAGEIGYAVDGDCVNRDVIAYQERINLLHRCGVIARLRALAHPVILEVGAGYGGLAYFLTRLIPHATYVIVDLPSALMFSGCYLTVAQGSHPVVLHGDRVRIDAPLIVLVPNGAAETIAARPIDLAINTMSFGEMPADVVRQYGALIKRALAKDGVLFEQNGDQGTDGCPRHCIPEQVLAGVFANLKRIEGRVFWGKPRLWRP